MSLGTLQRGDGGLTPLREEWDHEPNEVRLLRNGVDIRVQRKGFRGRF